MEGCHLPPLPQESEAQMTTHICEYCNHAIPGAAELIAANAQLKENRDHWRIREMNASYRCAELEAERDRLRDALEIFDNRRKLAYSLRYESREIAAFVEAIGTEIDKALAEGYSPKTARN